MLTPDVQVLDFTARDWFRLPELFRDGRAPLPAEGPGGVLAVRRGAQLVKVFSTTRGRLPPAPASSAASLAEQYGAGFALVISTSGLESLNDRLAHKLRRGQSLHEQLEGFLAALRELESEQELELWPRPLRDVPMPTERAAVAALDLVCPDGKAMVLGAFQRGELYTAIAVRRRGRAIDCVHGPDRYRRDMGLLSGEVGRDYRYLGAAVEARLAPVAVGCYAELATFQRLAHEGEPGAWAKAVAARDVILTPVTPGVALPLGIDAGRAALSIARDLVGRFAGLERFAPSGASSALGAAFGRAYSFVERDVTSYLGFDPWRLIVRWMSGKSPATPA